MSSTTTASTKNNRGKSKVSKSISHSARAGLEFPVGVVSRFLKTGRYAARINAEAPVYLSAVLEYLAAEVLEIAGVEAKCAKKTRIKPKHIQVGVRKDEELCKLFKGVIIANGGVMPNLKQNLSPPSG